MLLDQPQMAVPPLLFTPVYDTLKELIREGNVRRIIIRNDKGRTLLDMPLSAGIAGAVLLPFWMAVGAILALAKEFSVSVERSGDTPV